MTTADEWKARAEVLARALEGILEVEREFRNSMPEGWDGDPLSDACDAARGLLGAVGGSGK